MPVVVPVLVVPLVQNKPSGAVDRQGMGREGTWL